MSLHSIRGGVVSGGAADVYRALNVPRVRIARSSTQAIATATVSTIGFDNPQPASAWDSDSFYDPAASTTRVTVNTPGCYDVKASVAWAGSAGGTIRVAWLHKNGSAATRYGSDARAPFAAAQVFCNISTEMQLNRGDYIELIVFQDSGGNLNITTVAPSAAAELMLTLASTIG